MARVARRKRRSISLVWVIPLVAVLVGLYLVVHALRTQGPTIEIQFKTAEGLEAGKTRIKYKNVDIGTVQTITLGPGKKGVVVKAQMTRNATDLLVDDTRFWIVKPRIAGGQISGLTTLLSGSYIGMDVGKSTDSRREFIGLDTQPAVTTDEPGREFLLHAADIGSLDIGSPVFFRRFQVGEVTAIQLDPDGKGVTAHVFVHSPNEKYVTQNTRFWQASGIDVTIDGSGVRVATQSLVSVVVGGIAFQSPENESPGPPVANDTAFMLFDNERMAMKRSEGQLERYIA
ncbi:MAG: intermembrane transport protein PqiB, partial [Burkholderiaceae bacterium]